MDLHTGTPLAQLIGGAPPTYSPLTRNHECDLVIVGGGVTGAMVAYFLAGQTKEIILLESRKIGQGSTLASTSLLSHALDVHLTDLAARIGLHAATSVYRAGLDAVSQIESITRELGDDCEFRRKQSLYFASTKSDAIELRREYELRDKVGLPVEYWDEKQIHRRCAFAAPSAIWSGGEGQIDAFRFTHAALRFASTRGVKIHEDTCVSSVKRTHNGFVLETLGGYRVQTRDLVIATGYESQTYLRTRPASLMSTFALCSNPLPAITGWPDDCLIWETARPYIYLRRTIDGRVMIGGEDEPGPLTHTAPELVTAKCSKLRDRFSAMFPEIRLEPFCSWGGTFVETPDGLPYISQHEDLPGAWFALGFGGNGITFAVVAAQIITASLRGDPHPDTALYGFNRQNS